jgi:hypothetical protein
VNWRHLPDRARIASTTTQRTTMTSEAAKASLAAARVSDDQSVAEIMDSVRTGAVASSRMMVVGIVRVLSTNGLENRRMGL